MYIVMLCCSFLHVGAIPTYNCYTEGQLSFGITNLDCTGSENYILNCSHSNPVLYNCRSHNDAGIICQGTFTLGMKGLALMHNIKYI